MVAGADTIEVAGTTVPPGERAHLRFEIAESYLTDPMTVPVTVLNGVEPGPTLFLSAAVHGDELNGVEVVRHVVDELDHADLHGALVCLHVVNGPGFNVQERYLPLVDSDLNRAFPGSPSGNWAARIADSLYRTFIRGCDLGLDFHTSTRGRTNLVHVRGDLSDPGVDRLARAFGSRVVLDEPGPHGSLRRVATADGIPTVTVEMGEAHRFQRDIIDRGVAGVLSVLAEYGLHPARSVRWPGWRVVVPVHERARWIRAAAGGIVEMAAGGGEVVEAGERLCTITNPFERTLVEVVAPTTGLLVGLLENPVVYPGNPLCHLVEVDDETAATIRAVEESAA